MDSLLALEQMVQSKNQHNLVPINTMKQGMICNVPMNDTESIIIRSVCIDNNNQLYIAGQTFGSLDNGKGLKFELNSFLTQS
jgi:hypothetical protein